MAVYGDFERAICKCGSHLSYTTPNSKHLEAITSFIEGLSLLYQQVMENGDVRGDVNE